VPRPLTDQGLAQHVGDLHRVVTSRPTDTIVVLGHSWGGLVAQAWAEAHPEAVDGLILTGSLGPTDEVNEVVKKSIRRAGKAAADRGLPPPPGPLGPGCEAHWHVFRAYYADPSRIRARDLPRHCDAELNRLVWSAVDDYAIDLTALAAPTLVLWGEADPVRVSVPALRDSLPAHARFEMLADCGHRPMFECPQAFDPEVLRLVREASTPAAATARAQR
jgi:pimeloyl-ACP methyl ester carboxylesterase